MSDSARAYRVVDGERIDGTWRSVFVHNGDYHLADLVVYADGVIDCWGEITLEELREHLRTGWVTLAPGAGATGNAGFAHWRFAEPQAWITADEFFAEVADEIERLAGRPTVSARCLAALDRFLGDPTEGNRLELRAAYLAVPAHLRQYLCHDMDHKDWPLRVLITEIGEPLHGAPDGDPVTEAWRADALRYFARREKTAARLAARDTADGPAAPQSPTVLLTYGPHVLRAEYPAPIDVGGRQYPTVTHAYWALSVADADLHDAVQAAATVLDARRLAEAARRRNGWAEARVAVMAALLRAKFAQHPALAEELLATGDGRIEYTYGESDFWSSGQPGRGWLGRLLELVRAELAAERNGLTFTT